MPNPLNKNKVISYIKRFPHGGKFNLVQGNTPLALKPGEATPSPTVLPTCTVGLSGTAGNPINFTELLAMWKAGGLTRSNINPYGLMRIWAAIYRTYYDWVTSVSRLYPNPTSSTITFTNSLIDPRTYKVSYKAGQGIGSVDGKTTTGSYTKSSNTSSLNTQITLPSGGTEFPQLSIEGYYPDLYTSDVVGTGQTGAGTVTLPFGGGIKLYGGPITCTIELDETSDVTKVVIPPPLGELPRIYVNSGSSVPGILGAYNYASPASSDALFNWFFPSNFIFKTSADGVTYNLTYQYGDLLTSLPLSTWDVYPINQGNANNQRITYAPKQIVRTRTSPLPAAETGEPRGYTLINVAYSSITTTPVPFEYTISSVTTNNSNYEIVLPNPITNNSTIQVLQKSNNTFKSCTVTATSGNNVKTYVSSNEITNDLYRNNSLFALELVHTLTIKDGSTTIYQATIKPSIWPAKAVKALQITSGIQDGTVLRKYIGSFPYLEGTTKIAVVSNNSNQVSDNYTPDFNDSFWTTYGPTSFTIGGTILTDAIASNAFNYTNFSGTNVDRWKLLPYTLPISSAGLKSQIDSTVATIKNIPFGFDYYDDYIDNSIIPIPSISDLTSIEAEAKVLNSKPEEYYLRTKLNGLLNELISHCKSTCLKFWKVNPELSVRNYRKYTSNVLKVDNISQPISSVRGGGTIQIYEITTPVDLSSSIEPSNLWFLSGGGPSRVEVDLAVLQKIVELTGLTQ